MKRRFLKPSILIVLLIFSNIITAQDLDLNGFELKAHYELSSNGIDLTENYDIIELDNPIFSFGGILSRGCYVLNSNFGDSCLIETPEIIAMNDLSFAIQVDFRLSSYGKPIIIAGHHFRYLGLETNFDGILTLITNNSTRDEIENIFLEKDEWYNIVLIHHTLDSTTQVYLNQELVFTKKKDLSHTEDDNNISNSNFSQGRAFKGYWKDLKVYSSNMISSVQNLEKNHYDIHLFPNPASTLLNLEIPMSQNLNYAIFNIYGRCIEKSDFNDTAINIMNLNSGLYTIVLFKEKKFLGRAKFIKK